MICVMIGCSNRSDRDGVRFFKLPKVVTDRGEQMLTLTTERQLAWLKAISRDDLTKEKLSNVFVCERHFVSGKPAYEMYQLDIDWSPSQHLGHDKLAVDSVKLAEAQQRASRAAVRAERREEILASTSANETHVVQSEDVNCKTCDQQIETEHTGDIPVNIFEEEYFLKNDDQVLYYTGLSNGELLSSVFQLVIPYPGTSRKYYWSSFVMTLMKLRLNLGHQDLAYRFNINKSTVSRRFDDMLNIMYTRLKFLVFWPDQEELWKTMPLCFHPHYGLKVAAIIDCYEIKIEKPSNLLARAATWSQYKHSNTVKILIAIAPQGMTTFVSNSWGGRVSDKHLTMNSGLLQKLLPGDVVLADRGFDVGEVVAMAQASLHMPAFTKGLDQLPPVEVEKTRKLANVRIHVERVIGATRQRFSILMSILPIQYVIKKSPQDIPNVDKIVYICSALNNLCVSVVPFE